MNAYALDWWDSYLDPYARLETVARYLVEQDSESTFYDLFNFIREKLFLGGTYDEDSDFIKEVDFEIAYELSTNK